MEKLNADWREMERTRKELFIKLLNKYVALQKEVCSGYTFLHNRTTFIDEEAKELRENWRKIETREIPNEETCVWIPVDKCFLTECRHGINYDPLYVYCPYCGRKISG